VSKQIQLGSALLWASAIVASAALDAPATLTLVVLPALAAGAWALTLTRTRACAARPAGAA
jgi:hypothetical protein